VLIGKYDWWWTFMGSAQENTEKIPMKQCNFSVPASVYEEYRNFCKVNGIKMYFPLTIFMQQFSRGQFNFVFRNSGNHPTFCGMEVDESQLMTLTKQGNDQIEKLIVRLDDKSE
jgi:hypothetical protein